MNDESFSVPVDAVAEHYDRERVDAWSDAVLVRAVARVVSEPRAGAATSFVLHAPLELLARARLLHFVEAGARRDARVRIATIAARYHTFSPSERADAAPSGASFGNLAAASDALARALRDGDVALADAAATRIAAESSGFAMVSALAPLLVRSLAAAGHATIFLYLLRRAAGGDHALRSMFVPLARELARTPERRIAWQRPSDASAPGEDLITVLRAPPILRGDTFIHPMVARVEDAGLPARLLGPRLCEVRLDEARRVLLRVAAWSMLEDTEDEAPYGWTHALTIPQAVLAMGDVADAAECVTVAATFALSFRAALRTRAIEPNFAPAPFAGSLSDALAVGPRAAASVLWHAREEDRPALRARLATFAATHPDAHLAKYTLACFDAGDDDPGAAPLFDAAAAHLSAWWRAHHG